MKLISIKPANGDSAQEIRLFCPILKEKIRWNEAARNGWKVDAEGVPFSASSYYSPERLKAEGIK